jgi:uncharacterized membrane protein YfcA
MILAILGVLTGLTSGFFGIGGGTILVPFLLLYGMEMQHAVAVSIMQMVFSSIFGSFINSRQNKAVLKDGVIIGLGGFVGGSLSGFIVPNIDGQYLKYLFLLVLLFSIYRVARTATDHGKEVKYHSKVLLLIVGFVIGMIAMSIGVGGSLLLTPILVSFMYYNLKDAASLGLFFVIFSSVAGFLSLSLAGHMPYTEGAIVGIASLIGVYLGIKIKSKVNIRSYKSLTLTLYVVVLLILISRL